MSTPAHSARHVRYRALALATRGLSKSFGSLPVARDVEIKLPQGARYALIGPNGAGKTTLINLMTGMLTPNAGQILLGDDDITAMEPEARVRRGLARTFQINTLFRRPQSARGRDPRGRRAARHRRQLLAEHRDP